MVKFIQTIIKVSILEKNTYIKTVTKILFPSAYMRVRLKYPELIKPNMKKDEEVVVDSCPVHLVSSEFDRLHSFTKNEIEQKELGKLKLSRIASKVNTYLMDLRRDMKR